MIAIVDYGLGNVQAFLNIYRRLGFPVSLARSASDLVNATRFILPGVGAFDWAMQRLENSGMRPLLEYMVCEKKRLVLGVCVGMQIMAHKSDEGSTLGLGWFDANVRRFDESAIHPNKCLPHMGWNDVEPTYVSELFVNLNDRPRFYFLHSYYFVPNDPSDVIATSSYGDPFSCAVHRGNVYGVQFHPEKSHDWGVALLKNFALL